MLTCAAVDSMEYWMLASPSPAHALLLALVPKFDFLELFREGRGGEKQKARCYTTIANQSSTRA